MVEYAKEIVKATFLVAMFLAYCKDASTISMFQGWNDLFGGISDMALINIWFSLDFPAIFPHFLDILPVLMFSGFPIVSGNTTDHGNEEKKNGCQRERKQTRTRSILTSV